MGTELDAGLQLTKREIVTWAEVGPYTDRAPPSRRPPALDTFPMFYNSWAKCCGIKTKIKADIAYRLDFW